MQEFKQLDEIRKQKITRYKDEGEKQIEKYRQMVEILKSKQLNLRSELELKFKDKESAYLQEIESLRQQLSMPNNHYQTIPISGQHSHQQSQINNKNIVLQTAVAEKHPGYKEYQKTLEPISMYSNNNNNNVKEQSKAQRLVKKIDSQLSTHSMQSRISNNNNSNNNNNNFMTVQNS